MNLSQRIFDRVVKDKLINPSDIVVVGVSGGADSVALLHVLYQLRHRLGIKLHVAHFNHRLRPNSDKDELFVKKLAVELNLPLTIASREKNSKTSVVSEDLARKWRYDFFTQVIQKTNAQLLALAHNQNDLAETVLMRILRGTGLLGLRGILTKNQVGGVTVIRPFLEIQRKEIEKYLKLQKLRFRTDETNQQTHYLRNKIRLKLLPLLTKEYNNNFPNILSDLALTTEEDYNYILFQGNQFFQKHAVLGKSKISIDLTIFLKQAVAIQRMFLRLAFAHLTDNFFQLGFSHIKELENKLALRSKGGIIHWPQSVKVCFDKNSLVLKI